MSNKVFTFLTEHLGGGREYCALSNALIGLKTKLLAKTVSRQLTELKKQELIIITKGSPAPDGSFDKGIDAGHKGRRIYLATAPEVAHLRAILQEEKPPHPYETRYPDLNRSLIERSIRHDNGLTLLARCIYIEISLIAGGGTCEAPVAYYVRAFDASAEACLEALEALKAAGYIWLFYDKPTTTLACGTISGLYQAFTMAKLTSMPKELKRLRNIIKNYSIFTDSRGLKKKAASSAVPAGELANV